MIRLSIRDKINNILKHLKLIDKVPTTIIKKINTVVDCTKSDWKLTDDGSILINSRYYLDDITELLKDDIHIGEEYAGFIWQFNNHAYAVYLFKTANLIQ